MKTVRKYSLFHKEGKRWVRQSPLAFSKETAIRVFQDALLAGSMSGKTVALRPVKEENEKVS